MVIELERAVLGKKSFIVIKPKIDSRQSRTLEEELAKTLSPYGTKIKELVFSVSKEKQFHSILLDHKNASILAIDETQFFTDSWICTEVKYAAWFLGMDILISGLDLDYRRNGFNQMPELISIADEVKKLTAVCLCCGQPARFTQKISGSDSQQVEVGDKETYEARCASCYYHYTETS